MSFKKVNRQEEEWGGTGAHSHALSLGLLIGLARGLTCPTLLMEKNDAICVGLSGVCLCCVEMKENYRNPIGMIPDKLV